MLKNLIELSNIKKTYKKQLVLNNLSIQFAEGRIYGIIGKNGSGKTTLIKIIAGLVLQNSGTLSICGSETQKELSINRKEISFIIEQGLLNETMSAYDNMVIKCIELGIKDEKRISELLDFFELELNEKKKVSNFSLGMKQRLNLALALVSTPQILILDEPLNGLDPQGVILIRNRLRKLKETGVTIIISSHILSELYELATDFVFINKGKVIKQTTKEDLREAKRIYLYQDNISNEQYEIIKKQIMNCRICDQKLSISASDFNDEIIKNAGLDVNKFLLAEENLTDYFINEVINE